MSATTGKKSKAPWPTNAVMEQIYDQHLWGGQMHDFYSGEGSHQLEITEPYIEAVKTFIKALGHPVTISDLGCGDFNIGKQLVDLASEYYAVDIVEDLIERNKIEYKQNHLKFYCLDLAIDDLPKADIAILRQVLQHLSNAEIYSITQKLSNYNYVILTEHIPNGHFTPNKDIISGQGIRLKHKSGVDILEAPFNLKVKATKILYEVLLENKQGRIVTWLLNM